MLSQNQVAQVYVDIQGMRAVNKPDKLVAKRFLQLLHERIDDCRIICKIENKEIYFNCPDRTSKVYIQQLNHFGKNSNMSSRLKVAGVIAVGKGIDEV